MHTSLAAVTLQSDQAWQVVSEHKHLVAPAGRLPWQWAREKRGESGAPQSEPNVGEMRKGPQIRSIPQMNEQMHGMPRDAPDLFPKTCPNKEGKVG